MKATNDPTIGEHRRADARADGDEDGVPGSRAPHRSSLPPAGRNGRRFRCHAHSMLVTAAQIDAVEIGQIWDPAAGRSLHQSGRSNADADDRGIDPSRGLDLSKHEREIVEPGGGGPPVELRQGGGIVRWRECGAEAGATEIDRQNPVRLADHGSFLAPPAGGVSGLKIPTPAFQECDVVAKLCA